MDAKYKGFKVNSSLTFCVSLFTLSWAEPM